MLRTFDLFDTLIARRCVGPLAIYDLVAHQANIPGLASARSKAGHHLWMTQQTHTTRDIYQLALTMLPAAKCSADELAHLEFAQEVRETIPVLRGLEQVDRESIIVTDMHHPHWVLERLILKASEPLNRRWLPSMIASNQDKHTGVIWKSLAARKLSVEHLGDNAQSDVIRAKEHGHSATLFDWVQFQPTEKRLIDSGLQSIARACRSVRLSCVPLLDSPQAPILSMMCSHLVPILALGCVLLNALMHEQRKQMLVFSGRDGAVWQGIFQAMFASVPTRRLPLSRRLMQSSPQTALAMIQSCTDQEVLVADLVGSGASWSQLMHATGSQMTFPLCHLIRYPSATPLAPMHLLSLVDFSEQPMQGMHVLEALCEEGYPSTCDAEWQELDGGAGFAHVRVATTDASTIGHTQTVESLQTVLRCAAHELSLELARANDHCKVSALQILLQELVLELCKAYSVVEAQTGFWARNRRFAQKDLS